MSVVANRDVSQKSTQNGKQCRSRWDGLLWIISSGSTLFAKVSVLLCGDERVKYLDTLTPYHICPKISEVHLTACRYVYSQLSLSRIPRDSLKYFEISVVRHIRFAELRKKIIWLTTFNKLIGNWTFEVEIYWKYCGKEEKLLLRSNFSSFLQYFPSVVRFSCIGRDQIFTSR